MPFPAFAIVDSNHAFDPIREYYQMFPQEVSHFRNMELSITLPVVSLQHMTFESLVDAMIANAAQADKRFLVVAHGLTDPNLGPVGLTMHLTTGTDIPARIEVLEALERMIDGGLSEDAQHRLEHDLTLPHGRRMPKGTLARLNNRLAQLRALALNRVELRACALGANPRALTTLGNVLGTDFIGAPDVHMFYARINPGHHFHRQQDFERWEQHHGGATRFTGTNPADLFAMRVNGLGPSRTTVAATTSTDLSWFVDANILRGSRYPTGTREPARFVIAGVDQTGTPSFALPLDANYAAHMVLLGPLRRN